MVGDYWHIDLPKDVVFEILLRLPVTSILRFKCVCKNWYDAIESRGFKEHHYTFQSNSTLVDEIYSDVAKIYADKNFRVVGNLKMPEYSKIFATIPCRGLFLFRNYPFYSCSYSLGLYNPATRAFRCLPRMPWVDIIETFHYAYGLGWDPATDDYKVVYYLYRRQAAAVYSLNSDSWRLVDSPIPKLSINCYITTDHPMWNIYTNGFCYWIVTYHDSLVCFDVAQERFETVMLPPNVTVCDHTVMSTYYDSLALLDWEGHRQVIEVWVLRQEQQHYWTKVFSFTQMDRSVSAIGIWNNTHVLLSKYARPKLGLKELFMYDMKNDHHHEEKVIVNDYTISFINYKESLFSIKGGNKDWTTSHSSYHIVQMLVH